ncbi:hypothetical protein QR680_007629 [Steinernema hermaphroditum]|uniref:STAS domain-containing protein n=1 Tax=Steinernema hermaphroditum TaxID=289476 RepID=A0AA39M5N4_9BILA|nr:hypothetical protein QR680_007629 [Steinernema hermaphroditum]
MSSENPVAIRIDRRAYNQKTFDEEYGYNKPPSGFRIFARSLLRGKFASKAAWKGRIRTWFPPVKWLSSYKICSDLPVDLIAGITVCILCVPQAMAYAALANLPPVLGLYTSFFPTILYSVLGTSKHIALGMFAVASLMTGQTIEKHRHLLSRVDESGNSTTLSPDDQTAQDIQLACVITFCVGIAFTVMVVLQLHVFTVYLSDSLIAGFTTAAACHVFMSQLPKLFGLNVVEGNGPLALIHVFIAMCRQLPSFNWVDVVISAITIILLVSSKVFLKPGCLGIPKMPVPTEFISIVVVTVISWAINLEKRFGVVVVGTIPTGFPTPKPPMVSLFFDIIVDSISIAIVIFGVTYSVGKSFAKKHHYEVVGAQELRALAFIHVASSFFQCIPSSASLSRSTVSSQLGASSQVFALISSAVMLAVILFFGKFLYHLPMSVLASVIIVALQKMLFQPSELPRIFRISKIDFLVWMVSFWTTLLWGLSEGLAVAIAFSLLTVIIQIQFPHVVEMWQVDSTELFRDRQRYTKLTKCKEFVVMRYDAPLIFVNSERFRSEVHKLIIQTKDLNHFIIEASGFTQIDRAGVEMLRDVFEELDSLGISVSIVAAKSAVRELFEKCELHEFVPKEHFYPTTVDAVRMIEEGVIDLPKSSESESGTQEDTLDNVVNFFRIFYYSASQGFDQYCGVYEPDYYVDKNSTDGHNLMIAVGVPIFVVFSLIVACSLSAFFLWRRLKKQKEAEAHLFDDVPDDEEEIPDDLVVQFDEKNNLVFDVGSEVEECYDGDRLLPKKPPPKK